jgi:hypothetical protein
MKIVWICDLLCFFGHSELLASQKILSIVTALLVSMKMKIKLEKFEKLTFSLLFLVVGLISLKINFTSIRGSEGTFSSFSFISPLPGAFLGPGLGAIVIMGAKLIETFLAGENFNLGMESLPLLLWGLPSAVGAMYFGSRRRGVLAVPLLCIVLFLLHPAGREAWIFSLFWLIPVVISLTRLKQETFTSALGATFAQHGVGSIIFLYSFNISAEVWFSLIPIVVAERLLFALGITLSYLAFNALLTKLKTKFGLKTLCTGEKHLFCSSVFPSK